LWGVQAKWRRDRAALDAMRKLAADKAYALGQVKAELQRYVDAFQRQTGQGGATPRTINPAAQAQNGPAAYDLAAQMNQWGAYAQGVNGQSYQQARPESEMGVIEWLKHKTRDL
jgi:hypothetical protein